MDIDSKKETILDELTALEKKTEITQVPEVLDEYLVYVARTGDPSYPWCKVKPLIKKKIEFVINEFNEKYPSSSIPDLPNVKPFDLNDMRKELIEYIDNFNGCPFTLQRICELLTSPYKHYKRTDKFMRGLEKNILVVSTIEPKNQRPPQIQNSNHKSFFLPTPSSSYQNPPSSTSTFVNGLHDSTSNIPHFSEYCDNLRPMHHNSPNSSHIPPAPLQQLDSFTTVFVSPPSTPLAVVSDLSSFDSNSTSISSDHHDHPSTHHHNLSNAESNNGGTSSNNNSIANNHLEEHSQNNHNSDDPCSSSSTESGNESPLDSSPELDSLNGDVEEKQAEETVLEPLTANTVEEKPIDEIISQTAVNTSDTKEVKEETEENLLPTLASETQEKPTAEPESLDSLTSNTDEKPMEETAMDSLISDAEEKPMEENCSANECEEKSVEETILNSSTNDTEEKPMEETVSVSSTDESEEKPDEKIVLDSSTNDLEEKPMEEALLDDRLEDE